MHRSQLVKLKDRNPTFPRNGWRFEKKIDLFGARGHCENCGAQVRFLYHLRHPNAEQAIAVGSECQKKLTIRWRLSARGNYWAKTGRRLLVVFARLNGNWSYSIAGEIACRDYVTPEAAQAAAGEAL